MEFTMSTKTALLATGILMFLHSIIYYLMNSGEILYVPVPGLSDSGKLLVEKGSQMVTGFNLCFSILILAASRLDEEPRLFMTKALAVCFAILMTFVANAAFGFPPNYGPPPPVALIFSFLGLWLVYVGFFKKNKSM